MTIRAMAETMPTTIDPINAATSVAWVSRCGGKSPTRMLPPIWFEIHAVTRKSAAFSTIPASPSVSIEIGIEMIFTVGLTRAFATPKTSATIPKVTRSAGSFANSDDGIVIPGMNRAANQRAMPAAIRLPMNPFTLLPPGGSRPRGRRPRRSSRDHPTSRPLPGLPRPLPGLPRPPPGRPGRTARRSARRGSPKEEAGPAGVGRVQGELVAPGQVGAPLHLGDDRRPPGHRGRADDATHEHGVDDAPVAELLARTEPALGMEDREARGGPAPAGRAVHLAIREDRHVALGQR